MTTATSIRLPDLKRKPDLFLTNPIRKNEVKIWLIENIYPIRNFFVTPLQETWPTKGEEATSPHVV